MASRLPSAISISAIYSKKPRSEIMSPGSSLLPASVQQRIDRACDLFEKEWAAGKEPRIEAYLAGEPEVAALLFELLKLEWQLRAARGQSSDIDVYLARFRDHPEVVQGAFAEFVGRKKAPPSERSAGDSTIEEPARPLSEPPPPEEIGRYRVVRRLGGGAFGDVYLAEDGLTQRKVAIKVPSRRLGMGSRAREAFLREVRAAAQLQHEGIVGVYDFGQSESGQCHIVYQYVEGATLAECLDGGARFQKDSPALPILVKVAKALHHAHLAGLVHRDIKPANILLDRELSPLIADFGLAVREEELPDQRGVLAGTVHYMSPEQLRGDGHLVDGRTDIYSLGVILYEVLCGRRPFEAGTMGDLKEQILCREARPPRQIKDDLPPELEAICLKAMAKDVKDRFTTAKDLGRALEAWLTAQAKTEIVTSHPPSGTPIRVVPGYTLLRFLGRGGLGEVWRATAPGGAECALKIIFLKEQIGLGEFQTVRNLQALRQPNLIPIFGTWLLDFDGQIIGVDWDPRPTPRQRENVELVIATGLGEKNLALRLEECQAEGKLGIPAAELLDYMEDAARAIDFLAQASPTPIQHGGIKPQNVLIAGGVAQLADFGLLNLRSRMNRNTSVDTSGMAYAAPGIIQNTDNRACDQYSLAILYVESCYGRLPFDATNMYSILRAHIQGELDFAFCTTDEREVLERATSINPDNRYSTCQEMVRELHRAVEGPRTWESLETLAPCESKPPERSAEEDEAFSGYTLARVINRGGYGEIWEAFAPRGERVAVRLIKDFGQESLPGLLEALNRLKSIQHPNIIKLHAYWLSKEREQKRSGDKEVGGAAQSVGSLFVAVELAEKSLLDRLNECNRTNPDAKGIPSDELLQYMRQAAQAIDHVNSVTYESGGKLIPMRHGDIKPTNLLLVGNTLKLADLSLSVMPDGRGTPLYMAPEVFKNEATRWSDQYSLALTYCHLRTGQLSLRGGGMHEIREQHVLGYYSLRALPDIEREVVVQALSVVPKERHQSCLSFVELLGKAIDATRLELEKGVPGTPVPRVTLPASAAERPEDLSEESSIGTAPFALPMSVQKKAAQPRLRAMKPSLLARLREWLSGRKTSKQRSDLIRRPQDVIESPKKPSAPQWRFRSSRSAGDQPASGYRLQERLGSGGFGEVWRASSPEGASCAIKIIDLMGKTALKEYQAISQIKYLKHPNLLPIHAVWLIDESGQVFDAETGHSSGFDPGKNVELIIAMALGQKNLLQRLEECQAKGIRGIPQYELLAYLEEAAKGIDFLNQPPADSNPPRKPIIHRDIKPANLLISGSTIQVADFGLAREVSGDNLSTTTLAASSAYVAPEVLKNRDSRSCDQYSLAISYMELRYGRLPLAATNTWSTMMAHIEGRLDFSACTPAERQILKRATHLEPEARFASCTEMVRALKTAVKAEKV
jgi:serine/threonine protein kinase